MEDGDETALSNWRVWREMSVRKYEEEYARLNVHFDVYTGESQVGREWQDKALQRLTELNLIEDSEGAKLVNLEKYKLGKAVLRKKGSSLCVVIEENANATIMQTARRSTSPEISAGRLSDTKSISSTR